MDYQNVLKKNTSWPKIKENKLFLKKVKEKKSLHKIWEFFQKFSSQSLNTSSWRLFLYVPKWIWLHNKIVQTIHSSHKKIYFSYICYDTFKKFLSQPLRLWIMVASGACYKRI